MFVQAKSMISSSDLYSRLDAARKKSQEDREEAFWRTHRKVSVSCEKHGETEVIVSLKPDGTWTEAKCPECRAEAQKRERLEYDFKMSASAAAGTFRELIGQRYEPSTARFSTYRCENAQQTKALRVCHRFAKNFIPRVMAKDDMSGAGMLLIGNYGTGKTHLARSILADLASQGVDSVYLCAPDLFDDLNGSGSQPQLYLSRLCRVACLVIDEIGVQSWSDAERKRIHQIIDRRWTAHLPTIFVTNLNRKELTECLGERVMSRLAESTYPVVFSWEDNRQRKRLEDMPLEEVFGGAQ